METKSILLAGVGGQGTILASKILSEGLAFAGFDVKMSEIHGMSQRGGSVISQVRFGTKVESPVIEKGGADVLAAFEEMEALRYLPYLKKDGTLIIARRKIPCLSNLTGKKAYPKGIEEYLSKEAKAVFTDAYEEAKAIGDVRAMNMIILGKTVKLMGLHSIPWEDIIRENVKKELLETDLKAFNYGCI